MADDNAYLIQVKIDRPIVDEMEDVVGRRDSARSFASNVLKMDASHGLVVGVMGPWGSGKTSFLNLARYEFAKNKISILNFNPWMFSGTEHLVEKFFDELAAQFKMHSELKEIGNTLESYGDTLAGFDWVPVAGSWFKGVGQLIKLAALAYRGKKSGGISEVRNRLSKALLSLDQPVVVVVDDIDRLENIEVRDIFRLVRLTASFPNLIYLLAFDRERIEQALNGDGINGRAYLEKILQIGVDLPSIPQEKMQSYILQSIEDNLSKIPDLGNLNQERWTDIFFEVVSPLLRNMRDVKRYSASIFGSVSEMRGQVALEDILALEAVRIFIPESFSKIHELLAELTSLSDFPAKEQVEENSKKLNLLKSAAGVNYVVIENMLHRIFPASDRYMGKGSYSSEFEGIWFAERRAANLQIIKLYLERIPSQALRSFSLAEQASGALSDLDKINTLLNEVEPDLLEDAIIALANNSDDFEDNQVVPACVSILNVMHKIPNKPRGFFDFGPEQTIRRVIYRFLKLSEQQGHVLRDVKEILGLVEKFSAKFIVISLAGHQDGVGHKLISSDESAGLEIEFANELRAASAGKLTKEFDLLRMFLFVKRTLDHLGESIEIPNSPEFNLAILKSSRADSKTQQQGSRSFKVLPRLAWSSLQKLFNNDDELRRRVESARTVSEAEEVVIVLADKYLAGWRPGNNFDD
ncbi:hypothetical protein FHY15_000171 [Xanthomonas arboricola]|uniref:KAP family P-loop NTPase fold protein n=1 Tax=Xanthomonas arboricola TaxID=56448 RepID=UPI00141B4E80|nr:P-loop NTPase fold protein [Xanthomonas arboricola]NIK31075.1 hypothetical protein [Xanthomonas arboricola]